MGRGMGRVVRRFDAFAHRLDCRLVEARVALLLTANARQDAILNKGRQYSEEEHQPGQRQQAAILGHCPAPFSICRDERQ